MSNRPCFHFDYSPDSPGIAQIGLGMFALQYAELGYAVLPLVRGGKKPHRMLPETGGVHHATTDPQKIMSWWRADPAANIGVATGVRSRLVVIDLDVKGGHDGPRVFGEAMTAWGVALPEAVPYVITPSGGDHLWLRWPAASIAVPERPGILEGVDVKGDGGLVVAPPSMQLRSRGIVPPGERGEPVPVPYVLAAGCPCSAPEAPSWMHGWLFWAKASGQASRPAARDDDSPVLDLDELKRSGVPVGHRNTLMYKRIACTLYRKYGTSAEGSRRVLDEMRQVFDVTLQHGFSWREMTGIMESARKFIDNQIRIVDLKLDRQLTQIAQSIPWERTRRSR